MTGLGGSVESRRRRTRTSLPVDFRIWKFYGDETEIEHDHMLLGKPGAVRLLAYRNQVHTGRFNDAIAAYEANPVLQNATTCPGFNYGSGNATAPDLCWAAQNEYQAWHRAQSRAVHHRATSGCSFVACTRTATPRSTRTIQRTDPSQSGRSPKGSAWHRPFDVTGVGFGMSWISDAHARYLAMGGIDGFIGDGHLRQAAEGVVEGFYSVNLLKAIWLSADYQFMWNPGFNADRGPVNIVGGRVHAEF